MRKNNTLIRGSKIVIGGAGVMCCTILLSLVGTVAYAYSSDVQSAFTNISIMQELFGEENNVRMAGEIQNNAMYVSNQVVDYENYEIHFIGYYAEETTGNLLTEFLITDSDGGMLTEASYNNFQKKIDEAVLSIQPENEFNGSMDVHLSKDSDGNAILLERIMVTAGQQSVELNSFRSFTVKNALIEQENRVIGKFDIPEMAQTIKAAAFDTAESVSVKQITISGLGMQIVFDETYAKKQFEQELEVSGIKEQPDYDPEEHGYEHFKDMTLYMKDGTENKISDNYLGTDFANGTYSPTDDGNAYWSFAFKSIIDIDEIKCLEIDGVQYYPQSSY